MTALQAAIGRRELECHVAQLDAQAGEGARRRGRQHGIARHRREGPQGPGRQDRGARRGAPEASLLKREPSGPMPSPASGAPASLTTAPIRPRHAPASEAADRLACSHAVRHRSGPAGRWARGRSVAVRRRARGRIGRHRRGQAWRSVAAPVRPPSRGGRAPGRRGDGPHRRPRSYPRAGAHRRPRPLHVRPWGAVTAGRHRPVRRGDPGDGGGSRRDRAPRRHHDGAERRLDARSRPPAAGSDRHRTGRRSSARRGRPGDRDHRRTRPPVRRGSRWGRRPGRGRPGPLWGGRRGREAHRVRGGDADDHRPCAGDPCQRRPGADRGRDRGDGRDRPRLRAEGDEPCPGLRVGRRLGAGRGRQRRARLAGRSSRDRGRRRVGRRARPDPRRDRCQPRPARPDPAPARAPGPHRGPPSGVLRDRHPARRPDRGRDRHRRGRA